MEIKLLGTVGWMPNDKRQTSCVMIPELGFIFDAGTGAYRIRSHVKTSSVHIFLSHFHDDHICGLLYLLGVLWEKNVRNIMLYGRHGVEKFLWKRQFANPRCSVSVRQHEKLLRSRVWFLDTSEMAWDHVRKCWELACCQEVAPCVIRVMSLPHLSGESLCYDITVEKNRQVTRVVYVTDTTLDLQGKDKRVRRFARSLKNGYPVDLLITECNFAKRHRELAVITRHTSSDMLAPFLCEVRPRNVVLTHLHPFSLEAGEYCDEDRIAFEEVCANVPKEILVRLAHDNLCLEVGSF